LIDFLKTVKPEFSDTLDELVDVTQKRIDNSLELFWAINQKQSVDHKIKLSLESVPSQIDLWYQAIVLTSS